MNKIVLIVVLYLIILLAAYFLPSGISNYNAYVLLISCLLYLFLIRSLNVYLSTVVCWLPICMVSISDTSLIYTFIDCALIFFIFGSLYVGLHFSVRKRDLGLFRIAFFLIYLASVAGILNPFLYQYTPDGMRYMGLFHAINFSASVFSILGIAVWEMEKTNKGRTWILFVLIAGLMVYIWATTTRSLLIALPYWGYQLFQRVNKKFFIASVIVLLVIYMPTIVKTVLPKLRFEENESSMMTRSVLYMKLLSGIADNYAIIPEGSNAATTMVVNFTGDPRFSPHNDFLNYVYNWGIIFYIFCAMLFYKLRGRIKFNLEFSLILLAIAACALHNMMFATYIWIPFVIILIVRRNEDMKEMVYGRR